MGATFTLPIRLFRQVIAYMQTKIVKKGGNQNNTKNQQNANNNTLSSIMKFYSILNSHRDMIYDIWTLQTMKPFENGHME